ncbi:hypothetical protein ACFV9D_22085 [Streptomyces sp. NPDC059875]|uniref:hypothetical protein n=1 Tax=unclassified Streptomyces TaxID=2593676 RepID=UPI003662FB08
MSFGEPNNPYGQPQGQGQQQPGYGYPQQTPQGVPPQYGYPQAPPVQQPYGGGYPGAVMEMPGGVKSARVMLWILGGLQVIGALMIFVMSFAVEELAKDSGASSADAEMFSDFGQGLLIFVGVLVLVFAVLAMVLAAKFKSGGNGVRICSIVYGAFLVVSGVFSLPGGIVSLVLGILIIVFVAKADGAAWFNRPRQQY